MIKKDPSKLIGKPYNKDTYHCYHFIEECIDVPKLRDIAVDTVTDDISKYKHLFNEISKPVDYCIALLGTSHIGIYYQNGVYHNDKQGVRFEQLRSISL